MKILIVEDNEWIIKALTALLQNQNYAVELATDGQAAWSLIQAFHYDLILLDIKLPKLDGISLCRQLRTHGFKVPILLLTGQNSSKDKAMGLDAGADDYVVKPFDSKELVARIRALLRRSSSILSPVLKWRELHLDPSKLEVEYKSRPIQLTPKEYALLELFLRYPSQVFSCEKIIEHVWSYENVPTEDAVRTQIKGLRQKLKSVGAASDFIETVYGMGYRLKVSQAKPSDSTSDRRDKNCQQQTRSTLPEMGNTFQERVNYQMCVLEQAAKAYLEGTLTQEQRTIAQQEAHTLAASLCHYGLNKSSQLVRTIEHYLQAGLPYGVQKAKHLHTLVLALRKEIECSPQKLGLKVISHKNERPKLLIVDSDRKLVGELLLEAEARGIVAEIATNLSEARDKIYSVRPDVVLLDPVTGNKIQESLALLAELLLQKPPIPVLVFTEDNNLRTRLEVARLGGRGFLQKPLAIDEVVQAVMQVLQPTGMEIEAAIVVADNNPQVTTTLQALLEPWGLKVTIVDNPQKFWETLEGAVPDLLIMNLDMPNLNGIELCQAVRNDKRWSGLPILLLTEHVDANTIHQVFAIGVEDFVSLPIVEPELLARILCCLERIKLQKKLVEMDLLTGVCSYYRATQDLNKLLRLSLRHNQPLCLAILNVDNFKQINQKFGYAAGNTVLRQLGQLLKQSFRGEDVVSRWDREEFVIGMYGMSRSHGYPRLVQVLEILHNQEFTTADNKKFRVTVSVGVAQYPEDGADVQSLYQSGSVALEQTKATIRTYIKDD
ncbi:response regulator [Scytonema sp. UIC 10036]|uniref:response regulator n=1 Tax=Scytonema sp. UIC 10036 TaxID=2304196 RepID=UPI0012DA39D4|nr:response regulator [Scytonema sp. UIC 10036]MUG96053.1 response regulator [Scytonema sp. UIC 10036]